MYKSLSDLSHYLERAGSHATKESRTGRIDAIPKWAQEPEQYYNSLRDRYQSLAAQLKQAEHDLAEINEKLKITLPRKEFLFLDGMKTALGAKAQHLASEASAYRQLVRAASHKSWASTFYYCAQELLDTSVFVRIQEQTQQMLGREHQEIKAGYAEMTEVQRAKQQRGKKRQLRRQRMRARLERLGGADFRVVYSDENPG
jgi:hypothetical protein